MNLFLSGLIGLVLAALLGAVMVPGLHKLKFGQSIREEGPVWHKKKSGTPTMGGIIFIIASVAATFTATRSLEAFIVMGCAFLFGAVGIVDDYIIIAKKRNLGLSAAQKFSAQILIAVAYVLFLMYEGLLPGVLIPFAGLRIDMGMWYLPFAVFIMVGFTNAVNLTDGLDGLASLTSLTVSLFFVLAAKEVGSSGITVACAALAGALLGFLIYNFYPAKVFMGDTGSLFLGGFISAVAVRYGFELILVICGGVFALEALSVILQVASFKLTGKRIFKMAPLHHHFEMCKMREQSIVSLFTFATVVFCAVAYFAL